MAEEQAMFTITSDTREVSLWFTLLENVMKLPGAKVNRKSFLEREFKKYSKAELIERIKDAGTGNNGVTSELMDKAAAHVISGHAFTVTAVSFVSGLPGGLAMLGTIPVDLIQYYYHLAVLAQKLAYVYGWPDLAGEGREGLLYMVTVFIGMMTGVVNAEDELKALSETLGTDVLKKLSGIILAKAGILVLAKYAAGILGSKIFWSGYTRWAAKVIPLVGGLVSGGITAVTFLPLANTLKNELRKTIVR
jgi:hypothetical protein